LAAALILVSLQPGCGQIAADGRLPGDPATTQSVSTRSFASTEWSGAPGASGHPLMQVDAIRSAEANFPACLESLWPQAAHRGVSRAVFDAQTRGLAPDMSIMDRIDAQPEFTKAFWDYLDLLVSDDRVARGRELLTQHRAVFDAVERTYGVDRHVIAAIWGIESKYSTMIGERSVIRSTATLACIGRRQDYFRNEFLAALELLQRGDVTVDEMKGSWAGAFGPTQFMPTVYKSYAVDFDRDGRRDIVSSIPDLIASTANYFHRHGWEPGRAWGYEVVVPQDFNFLLADRSRVMTLHEWERHGIRRASNQAFPHPGERAFLMVPAGAQGPGFLMLTNFRVIMKYNPSEAYALAIGHLADRLRGGAAFVQAWPRQERVLTLAERAEMQQLLAGRGFDVGETDGRFGPKTRAAIRDFQASSGMIADGFATANVLARLRGGAPVAGAAAR
jgi:lytic murein transglycosylase